MVSRDAALRQLYLDLALTQIPRLLGAIDRNPFRETYGCLDRQFWHYRTAAFPSEMYQEGVLPLAQVYSYSLPGNRWYGQPRVRELAIAALRFSARSCYRDGSCDDYYPYERALGAAVFSLVAAAQAYRLLELDDAKLRRWLRLRCDWLLDHDESGRLANHQALAALGLWRAAEVTGVDAYREAAEHRLRIVLDWQSAEGWFDEYGGADPGYQTVTIDCLAKLRQLSGATWLDEPLARAVGFARHFLHPDDSYAGEYGSRGTYHFYSHGMELLAADSPAAADLADGFLRALQLGRQGHFDDDRMFAHRLGSLIDAYRDWSPRRGAADDSAQSAAKYFPDAGLLSRKTPSAHTVVSCWRGGVFKHFADGELAAADAGLIVELADGTRAVSQFHDRSRRVRCESSPTGERLEVSGSLHACKFETATPLKMALLHVGMVTVGRWCRNLVRRVLQRKLITGRRECGVRLTRRFEWHEEDERPRVLRVADTIELTDPRVLVRRMALGSDHQSAYVAAANVFQDAVLQPWQDLEEFVEDLNRDRRVTVVRSL